MTLSNDTLNRLKYALARPAAAEEIDALLAVGAPGTVWFVDGTNGANTLAGTSWTEPFATVQKAINSAAAHDVIVIAPGEYDEDVTSTLSKIAIVGIGPRHSVRITGTAAGTATALTLTGVQDVGLYNLNLEGRSGGAGLVFSGQIRRVEVRHCKLHGGTSAVAIQVPASSQTVDVRFEDNVFANATNGLFVDYSGGDPCHQIVVRNCLFTKITTDCIVEDGVTHDWAISGNVFGANDGTEPTQFLDIDSTGTTGFVCDNWFHTTLLASSVFAIAAGVLWVDNKVQAELPGLAAYGTSGRPD